MSEPLEPDYYPLLHALTGGHPFYITAVARRVSYLLDVVQRLPSPDVIKQAFLVETLSPGGRIYDFCQYVYDLSLQKAKGYGALKSVLQILAQEEGLSASDVARQLRVTPASASDYLRWLCEVDLVVEKDQAYYFRDPVLRFWVDNVIKGIEVSLTAEPMDLKGLIHCLDQQFQRVSEELGDAKESRMRFRRMDKSNWMPLARVKNAGLLKSNGATHVVHSVNEQELRKLKNFISMPKNEKPEPGLFPDRDFQRMPFNMRLRIIF